MPLSPSGQVEGKHAGEGDAPVEESGGVDADCARECRGTRLDRGDVIGSPHEEVDRVVGRIAEARRLLGETDEPIKSIAKRLGYRDVFFFSRQFRSITGVPPAMYRRSRQG